jgi:SAM-dependent methyltransferase
MPGMLYEDRERAESFGSDADRYDRIRPSYPAALVADLLADTSGDVLDVGCGTGIAGALFAAAGRTVLGVEPDARMARLARDRGLTVEVASFERWEPGERRFGLLVSGQAWHWVDPVAGAAKAAGALSEGGRVGLFWNSVRLAPDVRETLAEAYRAHEPQLERTTHMLGNADERLELTRAGLLAAGRFAPPELRSWSWTRPATAAAWREQLETHSDHRQLPAARREALLAAVGEAIERRGGAIEIGYETQLVTARRV